jgi:hypothetical protein
VIAVRSFWSELMPELASTLIVMVVSVALMAVTQLDSLILKRILKK